MTSIDTICWAFLCIVDLRGWPVLLKCFIELVAYQRVTQRRVISITMDTSISIILPVEGQGGLNPADPSFWTMQNKTPILNGAAESQAGPDRGINSLAPGRCISSKSEISKHMLRLKFMSTSCDIAHR